MSSRRYRARKRWSSGSFAISRVASLRQRRAWTQRIVNKLQLLALERPNMLQLIDAMLDELLHERSRDGEHGS